MTAVIQMAIKDLRILFRDRLGAFFILVFPILMGLFFGLIMGGNSGGSTAAMRIVVVDQDQSEMSRKFIESLKKNEAVSIELANLEWARDGVRKGSRIGLVVLPKGFGDTAGILWSTPPQIQLGIDPSRLAEAGMIQGFVMEAMGSLVGERFRQPKQFKPLIEDAKKQLDSDNEVNPLTRRLMSNYFQSLETLMDSMAGIQVAEDSELSLKTGGNFQFADIQSLDISREIDPNSQAGQLQKLRSRWDISFPQAMMWGVLGCVAGFSISVARERTLGTMVRLEVAPLSRFQILAGKALACFIAVIGVIGMLTLLGIGLGMRPANFMALAVAAISIACCFVGIMMTLAVLGKTEQSVSGIGWAANMVMAMLGGAMIPVMFMPAFLQSASVVSPITWSILAIEGAIWRQYTMAEMVFPCLILIGIGATGFVIGTQVLSRKI
ncbi:MAG: ABC transporter permease [Planctomycetota bacterium]|jgi:ABC-2 type transport system permease protein|nr:ABC transporter permease [Planctomycetota bacterium]MEC8162530.1 ABC transporter permease [Planctomycetota bacterium]MEC8433378.1 ABC transporter permease [Planctomycetota bacterium]MEC8592339.1 ABC transporter permease [Planctomycetota bacterium]MEE3033162.1 ABC transporter permease [Planctomycetota bacterium]